ncbi:MAG: hypothetical protein ACUVTL_10795 [Thermoproteota archaeon]
MIEREEGDKLVAEQIIVECKRIKGPVLIHKIGAHRAQRIVTYGFPVEAWITKKWRAVEK